MITLGIETSCDETAASLVRDEREILSNVVSSQMDLHHVFGGVVPELASRRHVEVIDEVLAKALHEAQVKHSDIDLIAVTAGPGLIGSLLVGVTFAKALAITWKKRLIGIDHLEAHLYACKLEHTQLQYPFLSLIVSGGHTLLVHVKNIGDYELLGSTIDDAAGEAFDKVAKILNLGYPGGPIIDQLSRKGDPKAIRFPRPLLNQDNFDFSFSGLKTAVLYQIKGYGATAKNESVWENDRQSDLAASFQEAVVDVLIKKSTKALRQLDIRQMSVGGGVGANSRLREKFKTVANEEAFEVFFPSLMMCTDNAAMIAGLASAREKANLNSSLDSIQAYPNTRLSPVNSY